MTQKLFGTDGVRGQANAWPMTAELALRLGAAAGRYFRQDNDRAHRLYTRAGFKSRDSYHLMTRTA